MKTSQGKGKMSKVEPLVSVVIPCFNLGEYLDDAIRSVHDQSYHNWEIIVVDDGSSDKRTQQTLSRLKQKDPEVIIITQKNSGPAAARNNGIKRARGSFIVCLDADDELAPDYLQKTVSILEDASNTKTAFVTTWLREFGERDNLWQASEFNIVKLLMHNGIHVASLFKKTVWEEVGGYPEDRSLQGYEDWGFWLSVIEVGYEWVTIPEPLFHYRIRKVSLLTTATSHHKQKFEVLYNLHQELYNTYAKQLILEDSQEVRELHDVIKEKNTAITEYLKAIDYEKGQALLANDKLESLYRSRITQIALKLIDISIYFRKTLPSIKVKIKNRLRRLIPESVKKQLSNLKSKLFPKTIINYENQEWPRDKPLISIVTPFYNHAATIPGTVNSVLKQTFQNFEYIIVDDGSQPEQAKVLDEIKDRRVRIIHHKKNLGQGSPATARNNGIKQAVGKYIVCLDSDDMLDPTYLEKCLAILESHPDLAVVSTHQQMFGSVNELFKKNPYDPTHLDKDNMVITAAMFRKDAWSAVGGYKTGIGYEDWEFWIELAEHNYWGKLLPEPLFEYRTAAQSRYVDDRKKHDENLRTIAQLHPDYGRTIKSLKKLRNKQLAKVSIASAFINLNNESSYQVPPSENNVLIALPWMTFGGAETLILNFCEEVRDDFNLSFITGLQSEHEWEYKFKTITPNIYHLANMFEDKTLYLEFISAYITTRHINIMHIIHTDFMYDMLPVLKERHPELKIILTMFNDRVEHFKTLFQYEDYIDVLSSDNQKVATSYERRLHSPKPIKVIPNGINCYDNFNPENFDRTTQRESLNIKDTELAVFFVGRLSQEKNPDVFIEAARKVSNEDDSKKVKFFLIGDGPMKPQIEDLVTQTIKGTVRYLGYQSEIARYLSAADIFVLPSSIEGFPLSLLEAMAMKLAVIASDVGAVSDIIETGENGFVITPGSAEEVAKIVIELNDNRDLLTKVKRKARHTVENNYSNTLLGENYKAMYESQL